MRELALWINLLNSRWQSSSATWRSCFKTDLIIDYYLHFVMSSLAMNPPAQLQQSASWGPSNDVNARAADAINVADKLYWNTTECKTEEEMLVCVHLVLCVSVSQISSHV